MSPFHFFDLSGISVFILLSLSFMASDSLKNFQGKNMLNMLVLIILLTNVFSLIAFSYSLSSYLWSSFLISLGLVLKILSFKIFKNCNNFLGHLLPMNSPAMLWDCLIILELLSNLIRPLTLSLRLTCNMLTGHVLLSLAMTLKSSILLAGLMIFELVVSIIQSQVFSMLIHSYLDS